ncbi:Aliphatic acid kinase, short-chain [Beauveria brongniartii RCEF 3172]|uniref:Probable acetate kinase n=1 Tax=Beauveria brongniartii RCEF 3172 TaxID=1081107 RepID=A0A162J3I2_9HYPO|nr:Aliphatic acid kinase, short-chain [Beauveria brongniartii RCEF 3172]
MKVIIAVNAGSSSVKLSAYIEQDARAPTEISRAQVSAIGEGESARLKYSRNGESVKDEKAEKAGESHEAAFREMVDLLVQDSELQQVQDRDHVGLVCHRIVHGGDYKDCQTITAETYEHLEQLVDLAPLHNECAMGIIRCCFKLLPKCRNVACFDTQFHKTIPEHIAMYPINQEVASRNGLRKYGFHGLSYAYMTRQTALHLGKDVETLNMIALHLGSGASACAIKNGCSWDTSMGLTPVSGLPGATRSGSIDPSLVFHYTSSAAKLSSSSTEYMHITRAEEILNSESGWQALAGTKDFGVIAGSNDGRCRLAFDLLVDRTCAFVGSYYVSLRGGVDALVFAGGIGERSARLRGAVVDGLGSLGFFLDQDANGRVGGGGGQGEEESWQNVVEDISRPDARHKVLVCRVDEQAEMARLCSQSSSRSP